MVEFQVLQCSECQTFQVLQVTKNQKWKCKLCGSKQSLIKVYGRGTGADCRRHVQKLNTLRGELHQMKEDVSFQLPAPSVSITYNSTNLQGKESFSHWTKYLDSPSDHVSNDEEDHPGILEGMLVTTDRSLFKAEQMESRRNKRKTTSKQYHHSHHSPYVKRYKEPHEQTSAELTSRKTPAHSSSVFPLKKESYQLMPSHFKDSQPERSLSSVNWNNLEPSNFDTINDTSSLDIHLDEVKTPLSEERRNLDIKPKLYSKISSVFNSFEKNITDSVTDDSNHSNGKKYKAAVFSSKSLKASKWDTFLEDDHCENIESDHDTELTHNVYGQLTVLLPDRSTSESFLNI